ncbi:unnamed protein product, partial [Staurois parvus]
MIWRGLEHLNHMIWRGLEHLNHMIWRAGQYFWQYSVCIFFSPMKVE